VIVVTGQTYALAVALNGQVRLRIYHGGRLKIEVPLSHRRALLLGTDLIRLAAEPLLQVDALQLKPLAQGDVAGQPIHTHKSNSL
jgi:hypothetical protein